MCYHVYELQVGDGCACARARARACGWCLCLCLRFAMLNIFIIHRFGIKYVVCFEYGSHRSLNVTTTNIVCRSLR